MKLAARAEYLRRQILHHVGLCFADAARRLIAATDIRFVPYSEAISGRGRMIAIPIDIEAPGTPESPYTVSFNGTQLTLWNRLPRPTSAEWAAVPNDDTPLWFRHQSGTLMPAWNLFANVFDLLTFREERESRARDGHGRYCARFSSRYKAGLLTVPAFNEAVAAIVAACAGLQTDGSAQTHLSGLVAPPIVVLSHDCDLLRGNDLWTQTVRAYRVLAPMRRAKPPHLPNLWWIIRNAATPRRFYFDNVTGMIDLERTFGYYSTLYLLNGSGGRFGARSGSQIIRELMRCVEAPWRVGMHYNYDTHLNRSGFMRQRDELESIVQHPLTIGRAHYLRFDPVESLSFWDSCGIRCDESAGYADSIGYRCGVGGCFQAYDPRSEEACNIYEVPLVVMDATLVEEYGAQASAVFSKLLRHLRCVGGALSIVFHPGVFHNPEFPHMLGIYHRLLMECWRNGAVSKTAEELLPPQAAQVARSAA